jgi:hypothetical protein
MRVLQERTQGRGHQLGAFGMMQPSCLALDKAHHIGRTQSIQPQPSIAEAVREKAPGEQQIVEHRRWGEPAFPFQVQPELFFQPLGRRRLDWRVLCNHAVVEEKAEQPTHNRRITGAVASTAASVLQIATEVLGCDLLRRDLAPVQPTTKIGYQLKRMAGRSLGVSIVAQVLSECIDIRAQKTFTHAQRRT